MKQGIFTVLQNEAIARDVYRMILRGDTAAMTAPGQFVNLKIEGCYLRRPISVCDCESDRLTLIYKTVGEGTKRMSTYAPGHEIDLLTGLGNGYTTHQSGESPLLIGGGVGVPPLYGLCRRLVREGKHPTVILGFNSAPDVFYEEAFRVLGAEVLVTTADGSYGLRGFVTDAMPGVPYTYFYTCGPEPMLKAVFAASVTGGQFSFEERMGCGFGACMGCSCKTVTGYKRICREGPVLEKEEILWETHR